MGAGDSCPSTVLTPLAPRHSARWAEQDRHREGEVLCVWLCAFEDIHPSIQSDQGWLFLGPLMFCPSGQEYGMARNIDWPEPAESVLRGKG